MLKRARRREVVVASAIVTVALLAPCSAARAQDTLPMRKAGFWQLETSMDEGNGPRTSSLKMCIDAEMERNTVMASIMEHRQTCSRYEIRKDAESIVVDADCGYDRAKVSSVTRMTGDFENSFKVDIATTTTRASEGEQSVPIRRSIVQTGTYLGSDCGDLQPGEAVGGDGRKVMVQ